MPTINDLQMRIEALEDVVQRISHLTNIEVIPPLRKDETLGDVGLILAVDPPDDVAVMVRVSSSIPVNNVTYAKYSGYLQKRNTASGGGGTWVDDTPVWIIDGSRSYQIGRHRYPAVIVKNRNGVAVVENGPPQYISIRNTNHAKPLTNTDYWIPRPLSSFGALGNPAWNAGFTYVVGDMVSRTGVVYVCILGHTNHVPPNTTYWIALPVGLSNKGSWNVNSTYSVGDYVVEQRPVYAIRSSLRPLRGWLDFGILKDTINTWTCPEGVTSIQVRLWGAGGSTTSGASSEGGGGGGAYAFARFTVIPGTIYYYGNTISGDGGPGGGFNGTWFNAQGGTVVPTTAGGAQGSFAENGQDGTAGTGGAGGNFNNCITTETVSPTGDGTDTASGGNGGNTASTFPGAGGGSGCAATFVAGDLNDVNGQNGKLTSDDPDPIGGFGFGCGRGSDADGPASSSGTYSIDIAVPGGGGGGLDSGNGNSQGASGGIAIDCDDMNEDNPPTALDSTIPPSIAFSTRFSSINTAGADSPTIQGIDWFYNGPRPLRIVARNGLRLDGASPGIFVIQIIPATDAGALTDSTGGSASSTIAALGSTTIFSSAAASIRDNFASLTAQINNLRKMLRKARFMK